MTESGFQVSHKQIPAEEYLARALRSDSIFICCDKCLSEMPDVNMDDIQTIPVDPPIW
jgi:hypothetical protein